MTRSNVQLGGQELKLDADGDTSIQVSTDDVLVIDTAGSERLRVDASGNIGVGLTSPTFSSGNGIHLADSFFIGFGDGANSRPDFQIGFGGDKLDIRCGNGADTADVSVDPNANIIIGKTTTDDTSVGSVLNATQMRQSQSGTSAHDFHDFYRGTDGSLSRVGNIRTTGSSTAYNTSSDYRLKENVVTDWDATTRLKQLKPSRFNFKTDKDTTVDGFLAHEVQSIVPEAVSGKKDAVDKDGNIDPQGIDQSKLVPLLVKTIQELEARIAILESK